MQAVHGDCQSLMCFLRNRTIGHSARLKTCDNGFHTLHFLNRHALFGKFKRHHPANIGILLLTVCRLGILLKQLIISALGRFLQQMNCDRIIEMAVCTTAHLMTSSAFQCQICLQSKRIIGAGMKCIDILLNIL